MFELLSVIAITACVYYFAKARYFKWLFERELKKHSVTATRLDAVRESNLALSRRLFEIKQAKNSDAILDAEIIG